MVNYGISRACLTCKARRIRCDEGRPTCEKCSKSKRTCLGYKDDGDILFRDHSFDFTVDSKSDRKVAIPSSQSIKTSDSPEYMLGKDEDQGMLAAMGMFFSDYVLVPKDRDTSRGYFDGLESLITCTNQDSELVRAARLVAFASAANKSSSQNLTCRGNTQYSDTLIAFQETLNDPIKCNTDAALMTAALLGLYEMIVAEEASPTAYGTHVKGVSAILCTRNLPFGLLEGSGLFQTFNPLLSRLAPSNVQMPGLVSVYCCSEADSSTKNLDTILIRLRPIRERASAILSNSNSSKADLRSLRQEASLLNKEFSLWPLCQPKEWMPQTLGTINEGLEPGDEALDDMTFWPGKVDWYSDLYIVAVWDTYRKARLKLLHIIAECSHRLYLTNRPLKESISYQKMRNEIQELVDGLCASIPFHLVADLLTCLQTSNGHSASDVPGKALGGLLLMYPLYIASTLPLISTNQRNWMRGRLRWIGKNMGIQQATMLANVSFITVELSTSSNLQVCRIKLGFHITL
jgi:hypothetical protein